MSPRPLCISNRLSVTTVLNKHFTAAEALRGVERSAGKTVRYSWKRQLILSNLQRHLPSLHHHRHQPGPSPPHLLLVFPLGVEASLDAFPGLLEGLPLGALGWVMGAHSHDVGTGEDQHIGDYLCKRDTHTHTQWVHKEGCIHLNLMLIILLFPLHSPSCCSLPLWHNAEIFL